MRFLDRSFCSDFVFYTTGQRIVLTGLLDDPFNNHNSFTKKMSIIIVNAIDSLDKQCFIFLRSGLATETKTTEETWRCSVSDE